MSHHPALDTLDTDRLLLRPQKPQDATTFRQLWTERDPRVPPHRQISAEGRPTVADITEKIRAERARTGPGLLAVERKDSATVIGYCGVVFDGNGAPGEPELAYELLRSAHGHGYATEAAQAVVTWAAGAGYPRLWAGVREWNIASQRVLDKLGFREISREPDAGYGDNLITVKKF